MLAPIFSIDAAPHPGHHRFAISVEQGIRTLGRYISLAGATHKVAYWWHQRVKRTKVLKRDLQLKISFFMALHDHRLASSGCAENRSQTHVADGVFARSQACKIVPHLHHRNWIRKHKLVSTPLISKTIWIPLFNVLQNIIPENMQLLCSQADRSEQGKLGYQL